MNATPPSEREIMLCFAYLAYCGESITASDPGPQILTLINNAMPQIPPLAAPNALWKVVWGPTTYTTPGALLQDNMMFIAQNQSDTTQFAIAVRGTNFSSDLDWLMEDFDVLNMMIWPPGATTSSPAGAMISESTSIGLQVLLGMSGTTASGDQTLLAFLASQASSAINVCVTGHSLGGCLSPTLALYLTEQQSVWDGSGASTVSCVTFAGPTAGNSTFANYSDGVFAAATPPPNWPALGTNCDAVRCDLDAAPLFWIADNISKSTTTSPLFSIYDPNLDFSTGLSFPSDIAWTYILSDVLPLVASALADQSYQQIVSTAAQLTGTYNTKLAPTGDSLVDYMKAFVAQAAYQHPDSYPTILGVPSLLNPKIIVRT